MKNLKDTFLTLIDNSANQAKSLVEDFNDIVNSFDWDAHFDFINERRRDLIRKSGELFSDFTDLLKQVRDGLTDFSVTVPFDESIGEKLSYEVVDGKLEVEVTYKDERTSKSYKTSVVLPNNSDIEHITVTKNETLKTATIVVPKIPIEIPNVEEKKKKTVKKKKVEAEETEHVSSKLAKKLKQNVSKYDRVLNRDERGRFVRREPKHN